MSLFDSASLVVTPSGYKEDKLYSIKPTDGSGDLVVTRATTATRINSAGLIEVVPYNLLQRSQEFENAIWGKLNTTITANSVIAPNNTLTADTFTTSNVNAIIDQNVTFQNSCVFSVYVKYIDSQFIQLYAGISSQSRANFDILNGVVGNSGTDTSNSTIQSVGNGWYRLTVTFINNSGASNIRIKFVASLTSGWGVNSTNAINSAYLWGAQLNTGSSAKEYFPTTDRLDVPRLDYTNSSCPSILVEPQRTNILLRSEEFDNAYWAKYRLDLGTNTQVSPSGVQNADTFTSSAGQSFVPAIANTSITFLGNTRYSYSIYAKKIGTTDSFVLGYVDNSIGYTGGKASYNLTTQSITITQSPNASVTATMQSVGNGWYRLVLNFLTIAVPTYNYVEMNIPSTSVTNTFAIWGAQIEAGSNATSYIPTIASSVTRNADVISKTGISSLIGQTEGTVFVDVNLNSRVTQTYFAISSSATAVTDYIGISFRASTIVFEIVRAGALQANHSLSNSSTGRFKLGIGYKANDFVFYSNGVQLSTDNSGTVPACNDIVLINSTFSQNQALNYNSVQLYKTRLSNTELAQLTTI